MYSMYFIVVIVVAIYFLFIFPTQWLKMERIYHPLGLHVKIIQISDMHVERLRINPEKLSKILYKENPDYIFLTGDYTKKEKYIRRLEQYVKQIEKTGIPTYAVLGNHDYKIKRLSQILDVFRKFNIPVLRNEALSLEKFQIVGIDDFYSGKSDIEKSFKNTNLKSPVIVLTHDPNIVPKINKQFDYLLSGHLHGKQFNIPFFFRIKNKGELPSKGIYKGLHHTSWGSFYISKGIGQAGINARLFVRSEITMHEL